MWVEVCGAWGEVRQRVGGALAAKARLGVEIASSKGSFQEAATCRRFVFSYSARSPGLSRTSLGVDAELVLAGVKLGVPGPVDQSASHCPVTK